MKALLLLLLLTAVLAPAQTPGATSRPDEPRLAAQTLPTAGSQRSAEAALRKILAEIASSGRVQLIGANAAKRLEPDIPLAPGAPPILAFRYFDGRARHRFGDLDLVMDDAGH